MEYTSKISGDIMTLLLKNGKEYKLHYSSNISDYTPPPTNLFKITDTTCMDNCDFITAKPSLMEKWMNGDFIHRNNLKYERLSQYEYDKYCYQNEIQNSNAEIYELYRKIM